MRKWRDNYQPAPQEFSENKIRHSNRIHAKIYATNYKRAIKRLPATDTYISPEERAELSEPVPITRQQRPKKRG